MNRISLQTFLVIYLINKQIIQNFIYVQHYKTYLVWLNTWTWGRIQICDAAQTWLKLYAMFRDLSRRSIGIEFWRFSYAVYIFKFGLELLIFLIYKKNV